jgi:ABC-2 type transport system ATP-binding protein
MLEVQSITKAYSGNPVLRGVDLRVRPGEVVALLGPNGAGKTTLAAIVAGLRSASTGTVLIDGHDVTRQPWQARDLLGLAPQQLGIYPTLTARRNLQLFGELAGLRGSATRSRIDDVTQALGLVAMLDQRAGTLSGGQQRRLHTAMALLHRPRLLLLDEPTVGADVESRRQILALVRQLADDGCAVCYATHYLPEIEDLSARVAVLHRGRIVADAPVDALVRQRGQGSLRLTFRGEAPDVPGLRRRGHELSGEAENPARALSDVFSRLGPDIDRLEAVEVGQPSLESAYLAITANDAPSAETSHAA